jgi:hypothetical protein
MGWGEPPKTNPGYGPRYMQLPSPITARGEQSARTIG